MINYTHHRDYKTCEHCGSHLDHGERCDCQDTKCKCCGKTLNWGHFAHEQTMCWTCYKTACNALLDRITNQEDRSLLQYAVAVVAEQFGEEY